MDSKEQEGHSLVKNKHRILNCSQKKIVLGGPREREARKVPRKVKKRLSDGGFRTHQSEKSAGSDFNSHKGRGKDQKGKGKERTYSQSGFPASEAPSEERNDWSCESDVWHSSITDVSSNSALVGNTSRCGTGHTAWMASVPLNLADHPTHVVLDLDCTRSIGSRKVPKTLIVLWHYCRILPLE